VGGFKETIALLRRHFVVSGQLLLKQVWQTSKEHQQDSLDQRDWFSPTKPAREP